MCPHTLAVLGKFLCFLESVSLLLKEDENLSFGEPLCKSKEVNMYKMPNAMFCMLQTITNYNEVRQTLEKTNN